MSEAGLHSNSFACGTPKLLNNRRCLIFQKVAGGGSATPIRFPLNADRHEMRAFFPALRRTFPRRSEEVGAWASP